MTKPKVWTEHLFEKHECMPYEGDSIRRETMRINGEEFALWLPKRLPRLEPVTGARRDDLLFVVSRVEPKDPHNPGLPVVLVARRRDDGTFGVHVWHELYPWALDHLTGDRPG
jgi:hypothetical protein